MGITVPFGMVVIIEALAFGALRMFRLPPAVDIVPVPPRLTKLPEIHPSRPPKLIRNQPFCSPNMLTVDPFGSVPRTAAPVLGAERTLSAPPVVEILPVSPEVGGGATGGVTGGGVVVVPPKQS